MRIEKTWETLFLFIYYVVFMTLFYKIMLFNKCSALVKQNTTKERKGKEIKLN